MQFINLKNLREDNDYKQREPAEVPNVSQNTFSQYETGVIELTATNLIKLSKFYNVSVDCILGLVDDPRIKDKIFKNITILYI